MTTELPRWTRQPPDVRRGQLLDAATEVILKKGYGAMVVSEVADRAGVGKGTVYLYFDSKLALLVGMQDRYWQRMLEVVELIMEAEEGSWPERLDRLVDDLVAFGAGEVDLYHALFHDTPATGGEPVTQFTAVVAEFLQRGNAAKEFDVAAPEITAEFLVSAFHGTAARIAHTPPKTRRQTVDELKILFRRAVGAS
jgi:TetR/AcrR family transcriptional regulator, transcriptional repressor for nem operon